MRGDLTQGPILRTLLLFSLPTLVSNVLQSLNGTINSIWVGRLIGESALAATANANIIMFLVVRGGVRLRHGGDGQGRPAFRRARHRCGAADVRQRGMGFCAAARAGRRRWSAGSLRRALLDALATPAASLRAGARLSARGVRRDAASIALDDGRRWACAAPAMPRTPLLFMILTVGARHRAQPAADLGLRAVSAAGHRRLGAGDRRSPTVAGLIGDAGLHLCRATCRCGCAGPSSAICCPRARRTALHRRQGPADGRADAGDVGGGGRS